MRFAGVLITVTVWAVACSRYESVALDPNACSTRPPPTPRSPLVVVVIDSPGIRGRVVRREHAEPLADARARLGNLAATSDTSGRFDFAASPSGVVEISTQRIGYDSRRDSLVVPPSRGLALVIPLNTAWSPYIACEIQVGTPMRRKPWWKWW